VPTRERQIFNLRFPSVLLGNDVLNMKLPGKSFLRYATILAPITRAATNLSREFVRQDCCKTCRALDCQYASRSLILA
jgi:hypothetical protein